MERGRPSKTKKWEHQIHPDVNVYTCTIDKLKRPSSIKEAIEGQKCIVILLKGDV